MTRHYELLESELLARHFPLFADAERVIADPVVRNRGTIGGSLAQADAAEDLSAVCSALKARRVIAGADGERVVAMDDFHVGPYMTAIDDAEILTEIRIPLQAGRRQRPREGRAARRRLGDRRGRPAALWLDGETIADAGLALSAVGLTTIHATRAEELMRGKAPSEELWHEVAAIASEDCSPSADGRGPVDYKRHLAGELTQARAAARGRAGSRTGGLMQVTITINGEPVTREIEPALLLVHFIRDTPGLTGTHWGCDTSNCGACVVQMDGRPVKSCTVLAAMAEGHEIRTIESLEVDGVLDPVQQGFHEEHGLQCGFCTPGMIMTARALLDANPDPTEEEIREAISGAICRCTGYANIVRAVRWAAEHEAAEAQRS